MGGGQQDFEKNPNSNLILKVAITTYAVNIPLAILLFIIELDILAVGVILTGTVIIYICAFKDWQKRG